MSCSCNSNPMPVQAGGKRLRKHRSRRGGDFGFGNQSGQYSQYSQYNPAQGQYSQPVRPAQGQYSQYNPSQGQSVPSQNNQSSWFKFWGGRSRKGGRKSRGGKKHRGGKTRKHRKH
jgi:hypothetical protein